MKASSGKSTCPATMTVGTVTPRPKGPPVCFLLAVPPRSYSVEGVPVTINTSPIDSLRRASFRQRRHAPLGQGSGWQGPQPKGAVLGPGQEVPTVGCDGDT